MSSTLRHDFYATFAFATIATVITAITVAIVPGGGPWVSEQLQLELVARDSQASEVLSILLRNALTCSIAPTLAYLLTPSASQARTWGGSGFLALVLVPQLLIVGAAIEAYGLPLAAFLPHLPIEWAALSLSAAVWIASTRSPISGRQLLFAYAVVFAALLVGSLVEVYLTP